MSKMDPNVVEQLVEGISARLPPSVCALIGQNTARCWLLRARGILIWLASSWFGGSQWMSNAPFPPQVGVKAGDPGFRASLPGLPHHV